MSRLIHGSVPVQLVVFLQPQAEPGTLSTWHSRVVLLPPPVATPLLCFHRQSPQAALSDRLPQSVRFQPAGVFTISATPACGCKARVVMAASQAATCFVCLPPTGSWNVGFCPCTMAIPEAVSLMMAPPPSS